MNPHSGHSASRFGRIKSQLLTMNSLRLIGAVMCIVASYLVLLWMPPSTEPGFNHGDSDRETVGEHSNHPTAPGPATTATSTPRAEPIRTDANQSEVIADIVDHLPLNADGSIEFNDNTKNFLNTSYNTLTNQFDNPFTDADLDVFKQQLIDELPGRTGDELATLVDNYFRYRDVEKTILIPDANGPELLAMFEQTVQLRRAYMGQELADALFTEEERMARYVIQERMLAEDTALTPQEKRSRSRDMQEQLMKN